MANRINRYAIPNRVKALLLAGALLLPTSAHASGTVQMKVDEKSQMTVRVTVNKREGNAVIDTAATYAMIDRDMLNDQNSIPLSAPVEILGIGGRAMFPTAEIGPVTVGEFDFGKMPAAVSNVTADIGNRSIIPASAFKARVIDFDFLRKRIDFYDRSPEPEDGYVTTRLKYENIDGLPFVKVKLNGKTGRALIDTGSDATYVNMAFAINAKATLNAEKTRTLFGADNTGVKVQVFSAKRFKMGDHKTKNFDILVADPPLFAELGMSDEPVMVMGLDMLKNFRLQIDREKQYVYLGKRGARGSKRHFKVTPFSGRVRRH